VDKAAVGRAERALKQERKADRGNPAAVEARAKAAAQVAAAEEAARMAATRLARDRAAEERARTERALQVRQIALAHRAKVRKGTLPFHFVDGDGRTVHRLRVSESTAWGLRCGQLAVVHVGAGQFEIVTRDAAIRLRDLMPATVRHFVDDTTGISDPDQVLPADTGEPSLRPHRHRA
jgi:uncharacterized protein YaiL (DUF2058 family)